ncbi:MAG: hypothetical protein H7145_08175 [Akkermansiaceae bacterium]|nr:hypothetical protein [Armatimonadota bacterium]
MSLGGCGGGGDDTPQPSPSPSPTASPAPVPVRRTVTFDVAWATRTRGGFNVGAINSARSATFSFYENGVRTATPTAVVRVNRDPRNDAYTATYTTGGDTVDTQQPCLVDAVFYANPDQVGSVVAGVSARSAINPTTGVLVDTFTLTGEVTLVELSPATAFVGETSDVAVTTRNQFGVLLPISPGSITLTVEGTGTNILAVAPGTGPLDPLRVLGIRPGSATIVALVDGARSAPATVNVNSRATVSIAPPSPAVFLDREITLSATVSNLPASAGADGQRVLWSVLTPNGGTISPEGVYRAPTREGEFLVQAQSVFDPTKTATTVVRVTSGVQVQVSPANASVSWLESTPFTAQVLNAPAGQTDVNWSVEGGDANGTITAAGVYTAPKRDGTFTVIATSVFDNRRLGTATVTVSSQVEVTISPSTDVQVNVNATQQFTATVTRFVGDGSVTWSVEPDANGGPVGTINSSGVYTAPAQRRSVFIRATSNFDPTRFARVAVQVTAGGADVTVQ